MVQNEKSLESLRRSNVSPHLHVLTARASCLDIIIMTMDMINILQISEIESESPGNIRRG